MIIDYDTPLHVMINCMCIYYYILQVVQLALLRVEAVVWVSENYINRDYRVLAG